MMMQPLVAHTTEHPAKTADLKPGSRGHECPTPDSVDKFERQLAELSPLPVDPTEDPWDRVVALGMARARRAATTSTIASAPPSEAIELPRRYVASPVVPVLPDEVMQANPLVAARPVTALKPPMFMNFEDCYRTLKGGDTTLHAHAAGWLAAHVEQWIAKVCEADRPALARSLHEHIFGATERATLAPAAALLFCLVYARDAETHADLRRRFPDNPAVRATVDPDVAPWQPSDARERPLRSASLLRGILQSTGTSELLRAVLADGTDLRADLTSTTTRDFHGYYCKVDESHDTALTLALRCADLECVRLVLEHGASVNTSNRRFRRIDPTAYTTWQETPLEAALNTSDRRKVACVLLALSNAWPKRCALTVRRRGETRPEDWSKLPHAILFDAYRLTRNGFFFPESSEYGRLELSKEASYPFFTPTPLHGSVRFVYPVYAHKVVHTDAFLR